MEKKFAITDEKLLQHALEEAHKHGESCGYHAKTLTMEDGQEYEIHWKIIKNKSQTD